MIRVRVAPQDFDDWSGLLELLQSSFAFMTGRIDPPSSLQQLDAAGLRDKAVEETLILAVEDDVTVGCAYAKHAGPGLYVGKVAVHENWRGRGVARQLIGAVEDLARDKGYQYLELQARIELIENHRTFAALGFEKTAETSHPGYSKATSITMRKPIESPAPPNGL